jgi:hypothetical protein
MTLASLPLLLLSALSLPASAWPEGSGEVRRHALVIGANNGGPDRVRLRFASSDAQKMAEVLNELGGIQRRDTIVLIEPDPARIRAAFADLASSLASEHGSRRQEVVVYYSGHSDEKGLLLGGQSLSYSELRKSIGSLDAELRVAILDSCASGAIMRAKGGRPVPAFLVDESMDLAGQVFLTSSSEDESSQEADRIEASFFTHSLVSGLRGGADVNLDGRVTLNEAYRFAYDETLAQTESSQRGAQHPAYDMQLQGSGDLVLTDLQATSATLSFAPEINGRLFIRDEQNRLIAELYKPSGRPVSLGLTPGDLRVTLDRGGELFLAEVTLDEGFSQPMSLDDFVSVEGEPTRARGGSAANRLEPRIVPLAAQILPEMATEGERPRRHVVALSILAAGAESIGGAAISAGVALYPEASSGALISGGANIGSEGFKGVEATGGANIAGALHGGQISGGLNLAKEMKGFQVTGGVNVAQGDVHGVQISGGTNVGENLDGLQLVGGVNIAKRVRGAQIGVVNIGKAVHGTQIGVVNICDEMHGVPIGVVTVCRDGILHGQIWTDDLLLAHAAVQVGSARFYTLWGVGVEPPLDGSVDRWSVDGGAGARLVTGRFTLDLEALGTTVLTRPFDWDHTGQIVYARLIGGYAFQKHLVPFGGPTLGLDLPDASRDPGSIFEGKAIHPGWDSRLRPGFALGLRF